MAVDKQVESKAWGPSETLGHSPGEGRGKPAPHWGMGRGPSGLGRSLCGNLACTGFFLKQKRWSYVSLLSSRLAPANSSKINHHELGELWMQTFTEASDEPALFQDWSFE